MIKDSNITKAFTLAEVLITLAIIGVIAALTIPSVVQNYQKTQTVTQLKKAYSALANTTNLAIAEHGPVITWNLENNKSKEFADTYLIPYLKVSKNCGYTTSGDCAFKYTYLNSNDVQQDTGSTRFYLNDGTFIVLHAYDASGTYKVSYADVFVDLNGQKKPNKFGKDIFHFIYWVRYELSPKVDGKFIAYGANWARNEIINDPAAYTCRKDKQGKLCAALIMHDGWEIRDDYPW